MVKNVDRLKDQNDEYEKEIFCNLKKEEVCRKYNTSTLIFVAIISAVVIVTICVVLALIQLKKKDKNKHQVKEIEIDVDKPDMNKPDANKPDEKMFIKENKYYINVEMGEIQEQPT
jgi:hypothetical protein